MSVGGVGMNEWMSRSWMALAGLGGGLAGIVLGVLLARLPER